MKIYSNRPIESQKWNDSQMLVVLNQVENPVITEDDEGKRFEADCMIVGDIIVEENIAAPESKYAILNASEYFKLNYDLSIAKGWELELPTERCMPMSPPTVKVNIQYEEGVETGYDIKYAMTISSKEQEDYPELFIGVELVTNYVPVDITESVTIEGEIETDVINWTMNHCEKQGVDTTELVTFIAGQDATNYPTIPNEGEWCETKVYSYNGDKVKCLQAHTRMHYTPEETPALWLIIPTITEGYPEWVQPTGAHDAYQIGDRVTYNDSDWESKINANVWSPIVYPAGWKLI